jgi:hypothetical protein
MDEVVELVVVIPTSPRSLKADSGCSSYRCFCIAFSSMLDYLAKTGPDNLPPSKIG